MFKRRVRNFQRGEQFDLSRHGKLNRAFSLGRNVRSSWISHRSSPTSARETRLFQHSALLVLTRVVRKMESFEHVDFSSPNNNFDFWLIARTLSHTRDESKARGEKTDGELFTRPDDLTGNFYFFSSVSFLTFFSNSFNEHRILCYRLHRHAKWNWKDGAQISSYDFHNLLCVHVRPGRKVFLRKMPLSFRRSAIDFILRHNVQTPLRFFYFIHAQMNCVCTSWQQLLDDRAKVTGTPFSPNVAISYERSDCADQLVNRQVCTNRALPELEPAWSSQNEQKRNWSIEVYRRCENSYKMYNETFS